jgi:hypothetical protein
MRRLRWLISELAAPKSRLVVACDARKAEVSSLYHGMDEAATAGGWMRLV